MGIYEGKFGPYVKCGSISASLPKDLDPETVTLETALPLVAAKLAVSKTKIKTGEGKKSGSKVTKKKKGD
jgi:DNA topoisomerase-1